MIAKLKANNALSEESAKIADKYYKTMLKDMQSVQDYGLIFDIVFFIKSFLVSFIYLFFYHELIIYYFFINYIFLLFFLIHGLFWQINLVLKKSLFS